jgi:transcriptional regulator with XRE-family HTH domain
MIYSNHLFRRTRSIIGHNIHRLRVARRWQLCKLALLSNVRESTLDNYEIGKGKVQLDELLKIACALEVGMERLIMVDINARWPS